ncbi:tail assembly chaperone [Furfurilactobacillus milii]|uniref:tail assembly chaperone n=1 Tax=Furfurilactobacillus milii TaxID=2888272 RepID=UPI001F1D1DFA|nr:tail assembly chaperone [Furfurilactobacillus milii]MCF6419824.1 tail assembly chaperone [Furfurilactobacillus milii]
MQALNINGKSLTPRINFRFRSVLGKKLGDDNDKSGFSNLITGLVQSDPDALLSFYEAALAGDHPSDDDLFDALDDQVFKDDDSEDAAFRDAVSALNNSGFFKIKAKAWKKRNEQLRTILQAQLDALADNDTAAAANQKTGYQVGLDQINDSENAFDKMTAPQEAPAAETTTSQIG